MARLDLSNATILVTGAASGIGEALARKLAGRGSNLVLVSRPEELARLEELVEELSRPGVDVRQLAVDLTQPGAIAELFEVVRPLEIDVLINNAGVLSYGRFDELDLDEQLQMVHVNVEALTRMTHAFAGQMVERGRGSILNVSSVSAFQATPYHAVYAATKAYVQSFSEALHAELAADGVYVGTLNPPYTRTPMIEEIPTLGWSRVVPVMTAEDVAEAGIETLERELLLNIPDWQSKIANGLGPRLLPRRLMAWVASRLLHPPD